MTSSLILSPPGRFAQITTALCRAVAACLGRGLMSVAVITLVWKRVRRVECLLLALMERVQLGRLRDGWVQPGGRGPGLRRAGSDSLAWGRLPRKFGWLLGLMPYEAAAYSSQLSALFAEPEMAALLRDVPQAQRIVAPLCRMLGVAIAVPADADANAVAANTEPAMAGDVRDSDIALVDDLRINGAEACARQGIYRSKLT